MAFAIAGVGSSAAASPAAPPAYGKALLLLDHPGGLYRFNRKVTDPASRHYRDYRSVEELVDRFGASRKASGRALDWLESRGFEATLDRSETFISADATGARSRRALRPADPAGTRTAQRGSLHLAEVPTALAGVVDAISVGDGAVATGPGPRRIEASLDPRRSDPEFSSVREHTGTAAGCEAGQNAGFEGNPTSFTPNQYLEAYGHEALHDRGIRGQGQRIAVVEIDGFAREDIETFGRCFGIEIPPISTIPVGMKDPLAPGLETTLDLELLSATAPGARRIDVYEGGGATIDLAKTISAALGRPGKHPDVVSISLGICEPQLVGQIAYWRAINNVFALSGAAGISTLVAAGDTGAGACTYATAEGKTALDVQAVSFPASSPFATAVGGTNLTLHPDNTIETEVTWNFGPDVAMEFGIGSGGGGISILSDHHPFYQRSDRFEAAGPSRVMPDVAALADGFPGYAIYCAPAHCGGGERFPGWAAVGGTSAATPLTAGGIALANTLAKKRGKARVGFANPLIYQAGDRHPGRHFRDVTVGDNDIGAQIPGSPGPFGCCSASKGYDPATGWGSIKFEEFAERAAR